MLKGIPKILSPELLKVLCEMGHSDRLVISDGNFPAESMGKDAIVIRCDGHGVPELLDAILEVFPLDSMWFSGRFCKISSDQNNNGRSLCNRILNLSGALIFWYG